MKSLYILMLAIGFAACNNSADSTEEVKDSILEKVDSAGEARVDSVEEATDSLKNKIGTSFEKTDSANKAMADSAEKAKNK